MTTRIVHALGLLALAISMFRFSFGYGQSNLTGAQLTSDNPTAIAASTAITFTTIDVPGAGYTTVQGINKAGDVVGTYADSSITPQHAFVLKGGSFLLLDYPGAYATLAYAINDAGLVAGYSEFESSAVLGFEYNGLKFAPIRDGKNSATFAMGLDNAGDVVGGTGTAFDTTGFELRGRTFTAISPPGVYVYVFATGVNSLGKIVGFTSGGGQQGFAYYKGKFQAVAFPGAFETESWGINDAGTTVGWYDLLGQTGCVCGFALKAGKYVSISYPGALYTFAYGINASGEAVGSYTYDGLSYHGFITSPITELTFR